MSTENNDNVVMSTYEYTLNVSSSITFAKEANVTIGYGVLCGNTTCDIKRLFALPTQNSIL